MENTPIDENLDTHPPIYTRSAVSGFAILFATIFGGVMLMQNLKDIGKPREARNVLVFSILYTLAAGFIVNIPEKSLTGLSLIFNLIGSQILISVYFKKHIPDETIYEKKKIWKPLIIAIAISALVIFATLYTGDF